MPKRKDWKKNTETAFQHLNLSVQKSNGYTTKQPRNLTENASATSLALHPNVVAWFTFIYPEKNLRTYPGTIRGTEEWDNTYKIRTVVEIDINHIKDTLCLVGRRTQNEKNLHADLILARITQLITVVLANKLHKHQYIRSLKPLITA